MKKRKIISKLKLNEISSVDKPAQAAALVTIMKSEESEMSFQDRVSEIQKSAKCSRVAALQKARELYPDEFESYQASGHEAQADLQKAMRTDSRSRTAFQNEMEKLLIANPKMKRTEAMRKLRDERPDLVEEMQAA